MKLLEYAQLERYDAKIKEYLSLPSQMGSTAIGGTSSYLYWNGSAWATKSLGSNAFTSISKVSQLTNDSGYITGITKAMVEGVLTGNITSHTHSYLPLAGGTMSNTNVVTNLNADLLDGYDITSVVSARYGGDTLDLNEISIPSIYRLRANNPNLPSGFYDSNILTVKIPNNDTAWQLLGVYSSDKLLYRRGTWFADGRGTLRTNAWKEIAFTDSNVSSSSQSLLLSNTSDAKAVSGVFFHRDYNVTSLVGNTEGNGVWGHPSDSQDANYGNASILRIGWDSSYYTDIFTGPNLASGKYGLQWRQIINRTAKDWRTILDSSNYNSYCPKLDGTGATGTWGISISGNAATATNADTLDGYHETGFYRAAKQEIPSGDLALLEAGSYHAGSTAGDTNPLPSTYASLSVLGKSYYATQLCVDYNGSAAWLRGIINSSSGVTAYGWHQLAFTDSNVASATKLLNSRTIWGQSFNGTGNVSGSLTGTNFLLMDRESNPYLRFTEKGLNGFVQFLEGKIAIGPTYAKSLVVDNNGNVGIGTTSPSYKLHIVGVAYASEGLVSDGYISSAATSTSSDIRLKDNISEISSEMALKWLSMLKPKSWTWNSLAGIKGRSMGFVAQDVEGILPQMIRNRRDNGYLSLDYTQLHAIEVSALQSHEKRIEELERENKILKEELNKLKLNAN